MIYFYNFWLLPAFCRSTPALGVLCSRCFIGATSYLANIYSFAGAVTASKDEAFLFKSPGGLMEQLNDCLQLGCL